jgi:hypothetical protein
MLHRMSGPAEWGRSVKAMSSQVPVISQDTTAGACLQLLRAIERPSKKCPQNGEAGTRPPPRLNSSVPASFRYIESL